MERVNNLKDKLTRIVGYEVKDKMSKKNEITHNHIKSAVTQNGAFRRYLKMDLTILSNNQRNIVFKWANGEWQHLVQPHPAPLA